MFTLGSNVHINIHVETFTYEYPQANRQHILVHPYWVNGSLVDGFIKLGDLKGFSPIPYPPLFLPVVVLLRAFRKLS